MKRGIMAANSNWTRRHEDTKVHREQDNNDVLEQ